jgi:polyribonucleotide nucleotidyltransferase
VTLRDKELELKEGELTKLQNDLKIMELNKEEIQNELEKLKKALKNTEEHHEKKIEVLNKELQNS